MRQWNGGDSECTWEMKYVGLAEGLGAEGCGERLVKNR